MAKRSESSKKKKKKKRKSSKELTDIKKIWQRICQTHKKEISCKWCIKRCIWKGKVSRLFYEVRTYFFPFIPSKYNLFSRISWCVNCFGTAIKGFKKILLIIQSFICFLNYFKKLQDSSNGELWDQNCFMKIK